MLEKISISKEIKNLITAPIPDELVKQREGGGKKMLSYLSGSTIIDILNNTFGYTWNWNVKKMWIEESEPFLQKWINGKKENNPEKWVKEKQGPVAHVLGTLVIYLKNENNETITIEKDGFGSKSILGKQNDQESVFKAAGTDALKKAASLLGIGLELYRDEEESAYFAEINYEDPWTEEAKKEKAEELNYIKDYLEKYEVTEEEFDEFVYQITEDTYSVTPDNIDEIIAYIKEQIEE